MKKLMPVLFVIIIISCATTNGVIPNQNNASLGLDPAVEHGILDNGLEYFIRPNSKPENRIVLRLVVNAGSIQEDPDQLGLAHLIEHMAFNGTVNFEGHEIINYLESTGMQFGADINAYTSFDETVYKINIPADDPEMLYMGLNILKEWAFEIAFLEEEIDKERGVVFEEWRVGRGANARMQDEYFPVLFSGSRYASRLPIGDMDIINNSSYNTIKKFYTDWYRPELMSVIVVGEVDANSVKSQIEELFGKYSNAANPRVREEYPVPDNDQSMYSIVSDPEATVTTVQIFYKNNSISDDSKDGYRTYIKEILGNIMFEERLSELTNQSDPPYIYGFSGNDMLVRTKSAFSMGAVSAEDGVLQAYNTLLEENERFMRFGFTKSEFERAKNNLLSFIESAYREKDKTESVYYAEELLRYFLNGAPAPGIEWEWKEVQSIISNLTLDEVNETAKSIRSSGNPVVIITGPQKDTLIYPGETLLEAAFNKIGSQYLKNYDDGAESYVLMDAIPEPGSIVSENFDAAAEFNIWELSNGSRVLFKETDLKNDEILFSAFSPGGTSLVEDSGYLSATIASNLVQLSGIGNFDVVDLGKAMSGKRAALDVYIGTLYEGMSGFSVPKDFETLLQLINLNFTSIRQDDTSYESFMNRVEGILENRESRPEIIFQDAVNSALYNDHFRSLPLTVPRLPEISMDDAYNIYMERFNNPGDFTFIFAGNIPDNFRLLVEIYIASIPGTELIESWADREMYIEDEVESIEVYAGIEPKSSVNILFRGDYIWTLENNTALYALKELLDIRLRETVREDASGTYGVSVSASAIKSPRERYNISIGFSCDPKRVEELTEIVFSVIEEVRTNNANDSNIIKIKEGFFRSYEESRKENSYWLGIMDAVYRYEIESSYILDKPSRNENLNAEIIREAAVKYLNTDNYFKAVLFPEK
jgi:zinc protease